MLFRNDVILMNRKLNNLLHIILPRHTKKTQKYIVRLTDKTVRIGKYKEFTVLFVRIADNDGNLYEIQDILLQIIDLYSENAECKTLLINNCRSKGLIKTQFHTYRYHKDIHGTVL